MLNTKREFAVVVTDTTCTSLPEAKMALVVLAESGKQAREIALRVIPQNEQSRYKISEACQLTSSLYTTEVDIYRGEDK